MSFHYPQNFFYLFAFAAVLVLQLWLRWKRAKDLKALGDWSVVRSLLSVEALKRRNFKENIGLVALLLLILASTGPQIGSQMKEVKHRGVNVFIAVDTSRSMLAEDVAPSRIERAKRSLGLLIDKLQGNRIGIIAFAKYAVIQCPLTVDSDAARMFLDILDTNTVPKQGTAIGEAIRLAVQSFKKDDKTGKAIVLITDGEDHSSDPIGAAKLAQENGVVIFTIGIGTTKGEVIKERDDQGKVVEFLKYKGEMVLSRMDDALLSKIASMTGGRYYRSSSTDQEIDEIGEILNGFDKKEFGSKMFERREERYQWFLLFGLALLLLEFFFNEMPGQLIRIFQLLNSNPMKLFSWKKMALIFLACGFLMPSNIFADVKEHIRKGNALVMKKDFPGARSEFEAALLDAPESIELRYNVANTYYLEGNFDEAKKQYEKLLDLAKSPDVKEKITYNLAHLTFSMGDRPGAIERFKECLRLQPNDQDAKYNIEYIRSGKSPKNPPQSKSQNNKNQNGGGQKNQKNENKQDQENQQNSKDQKESKGLSKDQAEQILQMMKDEEKDKMKQEREMRLNQQPKEKKEEQNGENW